MHTLRSLRLFANMSQTEWGQALGVSRTTVGKWESGQGRGPDLTQLHRMSEITGVSIDDIFLNRTSLEMKKGAI